MRAPSPYPARARLARGEGRGEGRGARLAACLWAEASVSGASALAKDFDLWRQKSTFSSLESLRGSLCDSLAERGRGRVDARAASTRQVCGGCAAAAVCRPLQVPVGQRALPIHHPPAPSPYASPYLSVRSFALPRRAHMASLRRRRAARGRGRTRMAREEAGPAPPPPPIFKTLIDELELSNNVPPLPY